MTIALAAGSTKYGWDLDNVTAPLVTATGDLVTLPALIIGSLVVGSGNGSEILGLVSILVASIVLGLCLRAGLPLLRRIVLESLPVLATASFISLVAGIVVEKQLRSFLEQPALLILVPAYFGMAGALGFR